MKEGTKFKVVSQSFFDNLAHTCYPYDTISYNKFIKNHQKFAGQVLTLDYKVGFSWSVLENELIWPSWAMGEIYFE